VVEAIVRDLLQRLGSNSGNSSIPPSANPPGAPAPVQKKKSKRSPGGQPGHPPHLKQLLPPERVNKIVPFVPKCCEHCDAALPKEAGPSDPLPSRHQVAELPELTAVITEYQGHARTCPDFRGGGWPPRLRPDWGLDDGGLACGCVVEGGFDELVESLPSLASNSAMRASCLATCASCSRTRAVQRTICSLCHWMKATTAGGSAAKVSGGSGAGASMRTATILEIARSG
jgi:Family of unknown function (DUF6444)